MRKSIAGRGLHTASSQHSQRFRVKVVLASASPRRQEILQQLGIPFESRVSSVREKWDKTISPRKIAVDLAVEKVRDCKVEDALVIGMDTLVVVQNEILGKPNSRRKAQRMLRQLSNRMHHVITGVALAYRGRVITEWESTRVYFRRLKDSEIEWYLNTGEAFDKAGAYAVQGFARVFVNKVEGCYYNVVGFPIACFQRALEKLGLRIQDLM